MTLNKLFFYLLVSFTREYLFCIIRNFELPGTLLHHTQYPGIVSAAFNNWIRRGNTNEDCQFNGVFDCDCEYNKFYCSNENLVSEEGRKPH